MEILNQLLELLQVMQRQEDNHKLQMEKLNEQFDSLKENILTRLGLKSGDPVVLKLLESRDDTVSLATREITLKNVFITNAMLCPSNYENGKPNYNNAFIAPRIVGKTKKGTLRKDGIHFNQFLSWELYDTNGNLLLSHKHEDVIIPGKFTDEEVQKRRNHESYTNYYPYITVEK